LKLQKLPDTLENLIQTEASESKGATIDDRYFNNPNLVHGAQAVARHFLTRRKIQIISPGLVQELLDHKVTKMRRYRNSVIDEIVSTETHYVESLDLTLQKWILPAKRAGMLSAGSEVEILFSDLEVILNLNRVVLSKIEQRYKSWPSIQNIGDILVDNAPLFKLYYRYIRNYNKSQGKLSQLTGNEKFREWSRTTGRRAETKGLNLPDLLIMPVQRLPRYELLLKSLLGFTNAEHEDYRTLELANAEIKKVNNYINDRQKEDDEKDSIIQLLLAQRGRGIGKKGTVTETDVDGYLKVSISNATNLIPIFSNKSCNALAEVHFGKKSFRYTCCQKRKQPYMG